MQEGNSSDFFHFHFPPAQMPSTPITKHIFMRISTQMTNFKQLIEKK